MIGTEEILIEAVLLITYVAATSINKIHEHAFIE